MPSSREASRSSAPTFSRSKSYSLLFSPPSSLSSTPARPSSPFFPPPFLAEHHLSFSHLVRPARFDRNFSRLNADGKRKGGLKERIEVLVLLFSLLFFFDTDGEVTKSVKEMSHERIDSRAFAHSSSVDF